MMLGSNRQKVTNVSAKSVEPLAYINIRSGIDYKKQTQYEQVYYRNHFLDVFDIKEFDENIINHTMDKLYEDIKKHKRYDSYLNSLLNRNTVLFNDLNYSKKDRELVALKLLFSYDTLDYICDYLYGYFYFEDNEWEKNKDTLIRKLFNELDC